ncbi:squalene synthase HpnC [Tautonia rosea]|uniref:squalene synthase HpnC n=1 Tax=Tautonia rosea TaxID=2728037 RepID=UPI001473799D|nr:squalene synthase HpnC [Tautonia rosea]
MPSFADDLRRFGPDSSVRVSRDEALAYCAALTRSHYENFSVVTWLTPPHLVPAFQAIYAFCRWSDDLGDEVGDRARATELLSWWRDELRQMDAGTPRHPVMIALRDVVAEFDIPLTPFEALISAFEQDQIITDYDSYDQLLDYCTRSANPVGHLILYLGRVHTPEHVQRSDATCTALQLANFWQDVSRDLDIGRVYLPREDRERFGYPDDDLHARRFSPAFARLLAFQVERTRALFRLGAPLADALPGRLAVDVELFTRGGLAILDRIEAQGFDVFRRRPTVGKAAKLGLLLRAILARSLRFKHPRVNTFSSHVADPAADAVSGPLPSVNRSEARP